jgi:hypothetical protein
MIVTQFGHAFAPPCDDGPGENTSLKVGERSLKRCFELPKLKVAHGIEFDDVEPVVDLVLDGKLSDAVRVAFVDLTVRDEDAGTQRPAGESYPAIGRIRAEATGRHLPARKRADLDKVFHDGEPFGVKVFEFDRSILPSAATRSAKSAELNLVVAVWRQGRRYDVLASQHRSRICSRDRRRAVCFCAKVK